jgi:Tol biopolymer transport system component
VTITGEDQRIASATPTDPMADTLLWSPDGTTLALVLRDPAADDGKITLAIMTPGSTPRALVASSRTGFWNLQWSPDGKRLAYTG